MSASRLLELESADQAAVLRRNNFEAVGFPLQALRVAVKFMPEDVDLDALLRVCYESHVKLSKVYGKSDYVRDQNKPLKLILLSNNLQWLANWFDKIQEVAKDCEKSALLHFAFIFGSKQAVTFLKSKMINIEKAPAGKHLKGIGDWLSAALYAQDEFFLEWALNVIDNNSAVFKDNRLHHLETAASVGYLPSFKLLVERYCRVDKNILVTNCGELLLKAALSDTAACCQYICENTGEVLIQKIDENFAIKLAQSASLSCFEYLAIRFPVIMQSAKVADILKARDFDRVAFSWFQKKMQEKWMNQPQALASPAPTDATHPPFTACDGRFVGSKGWTGAAPLTSVDDDDNAMSALVVKRK